MTTADNTQESPKDVLKSYNKFLLMSKAYYFLSSGSTVFLIPYITLWLSSDLGFSDSQIGVLCALRPWLSMVATTLGPAVADRYGCQRAMLVLCFTISTLLRAVMWFVPGLGPVALALLAADIIGAPVGPFVDSLVANGVHQEADYGKQRLWGSVGWGGLAVVAGMLVQRCGIGAGFLAYTVLSLPCILVTLGLRAPLRARTAAPGTLIHKDASTNALGDSSASLAAAADAAVSDANEATQPLLAAGGLEQQQQQQHGAPASGHAPSQRQQAGEQGRKSTVDAQSAAPDADVLPRQDQRQEQQLLLQSRDQGEGEVATPGPVARSRSAASDREIAPGSGARGSAMLDESPVQTGAESAGGGGGGGRGESEAQGQGVESMELFEGDYDGASRRGQAAANGCQKASSRRSASSSLPNREKPGAAAATGATAEFKPDGHVVDEDDARRPLLGPMRERQISSSSAASAADAAADAAAVGAAAEGGAESPLPPVPATPAVADAAPAAAAAPAPDNYWRGVAKLMRNASVWMLLLQCLAAGFGMGLIGTYLFLYARDLGASAVLMGLLLTVDCSAEVPVFFFQDILQARLQPTAILHLSLGAMVLRLLAYGALPAFHVTSPWAILPIELLQGLTLAAAWGACTTQCKRLAPPGLGATMQGIMTAVLGGLGGGVGGLLGGIMLEAKLGWPATWAVSAAVVAGLWGASALMPVVMRARSKRQEMARKRLAPLVSNRDSPIADQLAAYYRKDLSKISRSATITGTGGAYAPSRLQAASASATDAARQTLFYSRLIEASQQDTAPTLQRVSQAASAWASSEGGGRSEGGASLGDFSSVGRASGGGGGGPPSSLDGAAGASGWRDRVQVRMQQRGPFGGGLQGWEAAGNLQQQQPRQQQEWRRGEAPEAQGPLIDLWDDNAAAADAARRAGIPPTAAAQQHPAADHALSGALDDAAAAGVLPGAESDYEGVAHSTSSSASPALARGALTHRRRTGASPDASPEPAAATAAGAAVAAAAREHGGTLQGHGSGPAPARTPSPAKRKTP